MSGLLRLAFALVAALWLSACGGREAPTDRNWPEPAPALWEVTAPGGEKGWLFGTVHSLPEAVEWHSDAVDAAFAQSGLLVVEIAELGDTAQSFAAFQRHAYSPGLPPLLRRVPADRRDELEALIEKAGGREADYAEMKSWAAAMVLAGGVRIGDPERGIDRQLLARGKAVEGLESYAAQFALFDALPPSEQSDLLLAVAREAAAPDPAAGLLHWLTGDMAALEALGQAGILGDPELRDALMDGRNRAWIGQLAPLIDGGRRPFVAVGAAHMLGEAGLPALLAARGYTVRRIQ
ncbi:TraB/GumN family protein [Alteraurantiacibacter palmitatis]|uniref:TraB/GumN family protein n=1 Tax=Alteraurantiacibacter palmitatis TaxID=2054628 RepID=A0ABV7E3L3_9SPHN